jgi:hypothetical protein
LENAARFPQFPRRSTTTILIFLREEEEEFLSLSLLKK